MRNLGQPHINNNTAYVLQNIPLNKFASCYLVTFIFTSRFNHFYTKKKLFRNLVSYDQNLIKTPKLTQPFVIQSKIVPTLVCTRLMCHVPLDYCTGYSEQHIGNIVQHIVNMVQPIGNIVQFMVYVFTEYSKQCR